MKIVIDVWNGTDFFEIDGKFYDRIELDTYQNIYRGFNKHNYTCYIILDNSIYFKNKKQNNLKTTYTKNSKNPKKQVSSL